MRGVKAGIIQGDGIDKLCSIASSDLSLATSAITCSTGTLVVPSGS